MTNAERPEVKFTQEVRFAVVMYGGISLAIYMNGIAQELLKMVRATAPAPPEVGEQQHALRSENDLKSTECVYRKLGQMLDRAKETEDPATINPEAPIQTRFVIDILSGSSAGGINAVYLAKALANDQPLDEVKDLWMKEGDIGVLINDKGSVEDVEGLARQDPPRSLLNGQRMYWKLLNALENMDKLSSDESCSSPNAEELDLYVTATDMSGQPVELQLADKIVKEYRHRNVFHFRYSVGEHDDGGVRNDFQAHDNPFLAFAARCTSAHPAAFEPMRLGDIDEVLDIHPSYVKKLEARAGSAGWRRFFKEYLRPKDGDPEKLAEVFLGRDFNDGGVLDNRPFRHATDAMPLHRAGVPVSRKLVYLDPAPERLREGFKQRPRFNIAQNAWLSLSTLPRYEPIREDLQRVLERNRLIERVATIVEGMEERDFEYKGARDERRKSVKRQARYADGDWDRTTMSDMVRSRGLAWAGYQHLRVTEVTDELALLITRVARLDDDSDEFRAVRELVRCWRERRYDPDGRGGKLTEHAFLRRFDVAWRLRRLKFVLARIDQMLGSPERARVLVERATGLDPGAISEGFEKALFAIRTELDKVQTDLRGSRERLWGEHLWEAREDHPLKDAVEGMNIKAKDLADLLEPQTAQEIVENKEDQFDDFGELVAKQLDEALRAASRRCRVLLAPRYAFNSLDKMKEAARKTIRFYYDDFANHDMITYPILYSTGVGEEMAQIGVFRISPGDAGSLIGDKFGKPKLAGTELNNFGAFFEEKFRTSDILWGRLDGAERIITALLPEKGDEPKRRSLIEEAHRAILDEEMFSREAGEPSFTSDPLERFKDKYEKEYEEKRRFEPQHTVRNAARASRVFGDMLEGYAQTERRLPKGGVVWVTRLAQLFWVLVEVAIPNSLPSLLFRHGLKLLYAFEALAILLGTLLLNPTIQQFGFVAFAATAAVHATVLFLEDAMSKKPVEKRDKEQPDGQEPASEQPDGQQSASEQPVEKKWRRVLKYVVSVLIASVAVLGLLLVLAALGLDLPQRFVGLVTGLSETASGPPETTGSVLGTVIRGVAMFAVVVVFLLATGRGISKRLKG